MRRRIPRSILLQLLIAAVIAFTQFVPLANAQPPTPKKVLVLYSTRRDAEFSKVGENELPRLLDNGLAGDLDYYSEFVDRARFSRPSYDAALRDYLHMKYDAVRFDLVIAMQDIAADFVTKNRNNLFSRTPLVVLTNNPGWARLPNTTGVINPRNFTGTLAFIRRMQPDIENVFVVTGAGPVDKEYENAVRGQLKSISSPPNIIYLSGLTTPELLKHLSQLPPRSAVYYVLVSQDRLGAKYHPLDFTDRVAAAANAPTYSWVDSAMGHGILGGDLYVQQLVIEQVGQLALRVLRGVDPELFPCPPSLRACPNWIGASPAAGASMKHGVLPEPLSDFEIPPPGMNMETMS